MNVPFSPRWKSFKMVKPGKREDKTNFYLAFVINDKYNNNNSYWLN